MFMKALAFALLIVSSAAVCGVAEASRGPGANEQQLQSLVAQLSANPPGQCVQSLKCGHVYATENKLFELVCQAVLKDLKTEPKNPEAATNSLLEGMKSESDAILRNWPAQNRFTFKVSYSEVGGGWRSLFINMKVRTESTGASFTYTPRAATAGGGQAGGQWELDWVSTRLTGVPLETFRVVAEKLVANPPADCSGPIHNSQAAAASEDRLFDVLESAVLDGLNKDPASPVGSANATLVRFKQVSDEITGSWEPGERLRYQVFSFQPLIVIKLGIWNQDTFAVYAPAVHPSAAPAHWAVVQEGEPGHQTSEHLRITSLWRGPSGNPRFLTIKHYSACMLGMTLDYVAKGYEWHPDSHSLLTILKKQSSYSENGPKWKFNTAGKSVVIPYCWFGPLELGSVSAPICSVDTYDLSGNVIRFVRTEDDPEDLALIARVIKYAQGHDIEALNALCTSRPVARHILDVTPPSIYFAGFQRTSLRSGGELLDFTDGWEMKFTLKGRKGHLKVAAFTLEQNY